MNQKRTFTMVIYCLILMLYSVTTYAHSGRTDKNGGHWDRKSGTYHFHAGEYSGIGGGESSISEYVPFTPPYEPPTKNPYKERETEESVSGIGMIVNVLENILAVVIGVWCVCIFVFVDFEKSGGCFTFGILTALIVYLMWRLIEEKIELFFLLILIIVILIWSIIKLKKKFAVAIANIDAYIDSFDQLDKGYKELFQIDSQVERGNAVCIPNLYELGADNLPKDKNSTSDWGKSFTLYKTSSGIKLHTRYNCCSATNPLHVYRYRGYRDFSKMLCKKCAGNYVIPNMSWYEDYLKDEQVLSKRQNLKNNCDKLQKEIKDLHRKCNSIKTKTLIMFSKKTKKTLREANNKYAEMQAMNRK